MAIKYTQKSLLALLIIGCIPAGSALLATDALAAAAVPSIDQVYQAARAGRLAQAEGMTRQQVLHAYPDSPRAHYVMAQVLAAEGRTSEARSYLEKAERLKPGLPFASSESVAKLKRRLNGETFAQSHIEAQVQEIPILVQPNHPPVDLSFVGNWCGTLELTHATRDHEPNKYDCITFGAYQGTVSLDSFLVATMHNAVIVRPVSSTAFAENADQIVWRAVMAMEYGPDEGTLTRTSRMRLTSDHQLIDTVTSHLEITAPPGARSAETFQYSGRMRLVTSADAEAYYSGTRDYPLAAHAPGTVPGAR